MSVSKCHRYNYLIINNFKKVIMKMILQEIMNFLKIIRKMVLQKNRCKEQN